MLERMLEFDHKKKKILIIKKSLMNSVSYITNQLKKNLKLISYMIPC